MSGRDRDEQGGNFGGIFRGLNDLLEKLGELADKGVELRKSKTWGTEEGDQVRGSYGFSMKVGLGKDGEDDAPIEPFVEQKKRTQREPEQSKERSVAVKEVREPVADLFEEEDHLLLVLEMPGVNFEDIELNLRDDILLVMAESGEKRYRKEILLPQVVKREDISMSYHNGMLEIYCKTQDQDQEAKRE